MKKNMRTKIRRQRGSAMIVTIFTLLVVFMLVAAMMSAAMTAHRLADKGAQKVQATALAEAAVHAHYDAIKKALAKDGNYPTTMPEMILTSTIGDVTTPDGVYSSRIVGTPDLLNLDLLDSANLKIGVKLTWTFVLEGEGISPDGQTHSTVRASFTATQLRATVQALTPPPFAAQAAIQSNSSVSLITNGGMKVAAYSSKNANVMANDGVIWYPVSGSKASIKSQNVINVEGQIMVPGAPDPAYAATTGADGMGNPNGTTNYQTRAVTASGSTPSAAANTITGTGGSESFADEKQVATWQSTWIQQASTGTKYTGTITPANIAPNLLGERRITAPAYIDGDLLVNSSQIYLQPNTDSSKPNVIYVTGSISNATKIYNRGVVLVCAGRYSETSSSALYSLQSQFSLFTTQSSLYSASALVSLNKTASAIALATNSSYPTGLVYATMGGVQVKSDSGMHGTLIAGGTGANGGVQVTSTGSSFVFSYEPDTLDRDDFPMDPGDVHLGAVLGLNPTRLRNWIQVK